MSLLLSRIEAAPTTFSYTGSGGILFDGTAEVSRTITVTASGGILFDGAAAISVTYAPPSSGGKVFGGSAVTEFVSASTSGSSAGGGGWFSRTAGRLSWFAEKVQPKPLAKVFTHAPSGGISFGGSSPSSFTSSPRLRREEDEIVLLMALLG